MDLVNRTNINKEVKITNKEIKLTRNKCTGNAFLVVFLRILVTIPNATSANKKKEMQLIMNYLKETTKMEIPIKKCLLFKEKTQIRFGNVLLAVSIRILAAINPAISANNKRDQM